MIYTDNLQFERRPDLTGLVKFSLLTSAPAFIAWPFLYMFSGQEYSKYSLRHGAALFLHLVSRETFDELVTLYFHSHQSNFAYNEALLQYKERPGV